MRATRLQRHIQAAFRQTVIAQMGRRRAQGLNFRMRCGVMAVNGRVVTTANDLPFMNHNRAHRDLASLFCGLRLLHGQAHEVLIAHGFTPMPRRSIQTAKACSSAVPRAY